MNRHMNHSGFTLIEVLVTVLVLGTGILGVAALQSASLREGNSLREDLKIQTQAQNFMEQAMSLESYDGDGIMMTTLVPDAVATSCYTVDCTREEMAQFTLYNWEQTLLEVFPDATFDRSFDAATKVSKLNITWDHNGDGVTTAANAAGCTGQPQLGEGNYCLVFRAR